MAICIPPSSSLLTSGHYHHHIVLNFTREAVAPSPYRDQMTALHGWHRGERAARQKLGLNKIASTAQLWSYIDGEMPEQHSTFYTTRLPFAPVCILDAQGRPWGSILAGKDGNTGFIHHPRYNTLSIEARLWKGDPFLRIAGTVNPDKWSNLIAGIGIEVSTRRRNKFAGHVDSMNVQGEDLRMRLTVNEALGNCPKYITLRELKPFAAASSVVTEERLVLGPDERLSDAVIAFILESDTVFFGTTYVASAQDSKLYPSHVGMNHRGGRPGFIRVKPSDGRTVILPDFSGNRFMTSLGNVEATPYASLTFISFTRGDILYLTGQARNVYGSEAHTIMPLQDTLTEIYITGYTHVHNALPVRQLREDIEPSPYSPPIKLLAEEAKQARIFAPEAQPTALLTRITIHSPTIATFEWESSHPIQYVPGQAAIMDFRPLLGSRQYQHMAYNPIAVNDDFIRTWTISSSAVPGTETRRFALTIKEKPRGTVTGLLFKMVRKLKPEMMDNARVMNLTVNLAGISGDFVLPKSTVAIADAPTEKGNRQLLWIAGGIGVTPFLSMLSALSRSPADLRYDITLIVSTREPSVMISLLETAMGSERVWPRLSIHIFTSSGGSPSVKTWINFTHHNGRVDHAFFAERNHILDKQDTGIYLCGSQPFEGSVMESLLKFNIQRDSIHREGFAY